MGPQSRTMQIGELSRRSGAPRHMIHYYIRKGVLHPPKKVGQTRALYNESHLERLRAIKKIRQDYTSPLSFISEEFAEKDRKEAKNRAKKVSRAKSPEGSASKNTPISSEKKRRIKAVGIELFSSRGYNNTSVKEIVDRAGFSTGTFYLHFKSKKDLFNQVVVEAVKTSVDRIEKVMRKEKNIHLRNVKRIKELRANHDLFTEVLTQLRIEMFTDEGHGRDSLQKVYMELTRPFIYEIRQALKQRLIRPVDPDLLTFLMIGVCDIMLFRQSLDDRYDTNEIIAFVFDVLQEGLKLRTDSPLPSLLDGMDSRSTGLTEDEQAWLALLRQSGYNQAEAARKQGMTRQSLSNFIRRHPRLREALNKDKMK